MTTTNTETIKNVKDLTEAKRLVNEAFDKLGLKSLSVFVWADKDQGVEVKIATEFKGPTT